MFGMSRAETRRALSGCAAATCLLVSVTTLGSTPLASAAGDANMPACPNENTQGFRTYLPDCRSYELASPPFKNGVELEVIEAVSWDGSQLLARSVGTFAGAESNPLGAYYALERGTAGWRTHSISPPAEQFNANTFFTSSADLSESLWALRGPGESIYAANLYRRNAAGGFVKIGSMAPPATTFGPPAESYQIIPGKYEYTGASSDLGRAFFTILGGPFWPGDETSEVGSTRSLYEYSGGGTAAPRLVGVSDGNTVVDKERLPVGAVISNCTTSLGSTRGRDTYNAISPDGNIVFFTAQSRATCTGATRPEVDEVYARVDGLQTVAISEPTSSQCATCNTAEHKSATFQGASNDGRKVFFTTGQELLPGTVGANLYEYNFAAPNGRKLVLASGGAPEAGVLGVARVSQDGSHVYFVAQGVLTTGPNADGQEPSPGANNLYVFEQDAEHPSGQTKFVATLSSEDSEDWELSDLRPVQATPNGEKLVFMSTADLTAGDSSSVSQVFEYDASTEELVRVSRGQQGYPAGEMSADANAATIESQSYSGHHLFASAATTDLAISQDGSTVVFKSAGGLVPQAKTAAEAGASSVYEYHSVRAIGEGGVYLVSGGQNALGTEAAQEDTLGGNVFVNTPEMLLPQDADTQFDLYDARVDGGFVASGIPDCRGEDCQGPAAAPQAPFAPRGSTAVAGSQPSPALVAATQPAAPTQAAPRKARGLTMAQRRQKALNACRRMSKKRRRVACERNARSRFRVQMRGHGTSTRGASAQDGKGPR